MSLLKILVLDDRDAPLIAGILKRFLKAPGPSPHELMRSSDFNSFVDHLPVSYDIAVFDYGNQDLKVQPGAVIAVTYAAQHRDSLVVLKTAFELADGDREQVAQRRSGTIVIAMDEPTRKWDRVLQDHTADWLIQGRAVRTIRKRYKVREGKLAADAARELQISTRQIDATWLQGNLESVRREEHLDYLRLVAERLTRQSGIELPPAIGGERAYLCVNVDARTPWVPWEVLLFQEGRDLTTPISYVVPLPPHQTTPAWHLRKLLYVSQKGLETDAELDAIKRALPWARELTIRAVAYKDFVDPDQVFDADIVHLSMHGPEAPDRSFPLAKLGPLREALVTTHPQLLVLGACYGVQMLIDGNRSPYPFPVSALEEILLSGTDTIVTAQFPLENQEAPAVWCGSFYAALGLTGDAAIAAGWARAAVATTLSQLFELATVVVSRSGSPLAVTQP